MFWIVSLIDYPGSAVSMFMYPSSEQAFAKYEELIEFNTCPHILSKITIEGPWNWGDDVVSDDKVFVTYYVPEKEQISGYLR